MAESQRYVHIQTFGCQMNIYDTERMLQVLGEDGYASTDDPARADLILLNTCSVREKAEHKMLSALGSNEYGIASASMSCSSGANGSNCTATGF